VEGTGTKLRLELKRVLKKSRRLFLETEGQGFWKCVGGVPMWWEGGVLELGEGLREVRRVTVLWELIALMVFSKGSTMTTMWQQSFGLPRTELSYQLCI